MRKVDSLDIRYSGLRKVKSEEVNVAVTFNHQVMKEYLLAARLVGVRVAFVKRCCQFCYERGVSPSQDI